MSKNTIHAIIQIKNDLVAIRSLLVLSWYFSLHTRNVATKYQSIKPQNIK